MKTKIITICSIMFLCVIFFNINQVLGVGLINHLWKTDIDGDDAYELIFRTFTTPYSGTVKKYHKKSGYMLVRELDKNGDYYQYEYGGKMYDSKWVVESTSVPLPAVNTFVTAQYIFHKDYYLSEYAKIEDSADKVGVGAIGFNTLNYTDVGESSSLKQYDVNNDEVYDWADYDPEDELGSLTVNLFHSYPSYTSKYDFARFQDKPDNVFYTVSRIGGYIDNEEKRTFKVNKKESQQTIFRSAMIHLDDNYNGTTIGNVIVDDHVLPSNIVGDFVDAAVVAEQEDGCMISQVLISKNYDNKYIASRTVREFFDDKNKVTATNKFWSVSLYGTEPQEYSLALGSVANLYDNELLFPQLSDAKIYVRHIDLGTNNVISTELVNNDSVMAINNDWSWDRNSCINTCVGGILGALDEAKTQGCTDRCSDTVTGTLQDKLGEILDYDRNVLNSVPDNDTTGTVTENGRTFTEIYSGVKYYDFPLSIKDVKYPETNLIGFNIVAALDYDTALKQLEFRIRKGKYEKWSPEDWGPDEVTELSLWDAEYEDDSEMLMSENKVYMIDLYYSDYAGEVTVYHRYIKDNGDDDVTDFTLVPESDKTGIVPNSKAQIEIRPSAWWDIITPTYRVDIERMNNDQFTKEVYPISMKTNEHLVVKPVEIKNGIVYKGYDLSEGTDGRWSDAYTSRSDITRIANNEKDSTNGVEVKLNEDYASVREVWFYYYKDETIKTEPTPVIGGKVTVDVSDSTTPNTTCYDDTYKGESSYSTYSMPSGHDSTVSIVKSGTSKLPRAILGAVTTQYTTNETPIVYDILVSGTRPIAGGEPVSEDIQFSFNHPTVIGYDKVTEISAYSINKATLYDAGAIDAVTVGSSLYNWEKNKKTLTVFKTPTLLMTGLEGREITKNTIDIESNYTDRTYSAKYVNEGSWNGANPDPDKADNSYSVKISSYNWADSSFHTINYEYDAKKLDANSNGVINKDDVEYVRLERKKAKDLWDAKKQELEDLKDEIEISTKISWEEALANEAEIKEKLTELKNAVSDTRKLLNDNITDSFKNLKCEKKWFAGGLNIYVGQCYDSLNIGTSYTTWKEARDTAQYLVNKTNSYISFMKGADKLGGYDNPIKTYYNSTGSKLVIKPDGVTKSIEFSLESVAVALNGYSRVIYSWSKEGSILNYKTKLTNEVNAANSHEGAKCWDDDNLIYAWQGYCAGTTDDYVSKRNAQITAIYSQMKNIDTALGNIEKEIDKELSFLVNIAKYIVLNEEVGEALTQYSEWNEEWEWMIENYPTGKVRYDEYMFMYGQSETDNNADVASTYDITFKLRVQNMDVQVDDILLNSAQPNNKVEKTYKIAELLTDIDNPEGKIEVKTTPIKIPKEYYETGIGEQDYVEARGHIHYNILNGVRVLAGEVKYTLKDLMGIGYSDITGIKDTVYYPSISDEYKDSSFYRTHTNLIQKYQINNEPTVDNPRYEYVDPINIYTPITVNSAFETTSNNIVDQSTKNEGNGLVQSNVPFTITINNMSKTLTFGDVTKNNVYGLNDTTDYGATSSYSSPYYIKFDFDVHKVFINDRVYNGGGKVIAGTWIRVKRNASGIGKVTAQAYGAVDELDVSPLSEGEVQYHVRATAYNSTSLMLSESTRYKAIEELANEMKEDVENICEHPSYFAEQNQNKILILNRIYGFKVTDVKDVNWKSVFRTNTSSKVNVHNGTVYYSGITKWKKESTQTNEIVPRTLTEIGRNPLRTLPIGPYKNTDNTYINAPKMGYRFSFDMNVTGSYYKGDSANNEKQVTINTRFYYISKDGKTYLKEYDSSNKSEGIYLFYKASNGKYVRIDNDGGGYNINFTPNDGYRYIQDEVTDHFSKSSINIGHLRTIELTYKMATPNANDSVITYYGEYKLPNSTIAVKVDKNGNYDINKPLTNGYIGVVFDIIASSNGIDLSYSKDTQAGKANTSQWDYEGFMGYSNYGKAVTSNNDVSLRLEGGVWNITSDTVYNEVKGTVMLYDLDSRAATDFD